MRVSRVSRPQIRDRRAVIVPMSSREFVLMMQTGKQEKSIYSGRRKLI